MTATQAGHPVEPGALRRERSGKDPYIQVLRGLAIAAVALIHCLPESAASVALRPLLNWAVAMFLFLSGLLTTEEKVMRGGVIGKRLLKVAWPYLVWSVIYTALSRPESASEALLPLLTGGASAQMYYLLVYAQLVAITPLLFKLLRTHRVLTYAIAPVAVALWEAAALLGIDLPNLGRLFPMWLVFYLVGLEWERWRGVVSGKVKAVAAVAAVALALQMGEGFLWNAYGDYNMATTQLRLTNMASSLAVIALFMLASGAVRSKLAGCQPLVRLGDLSFGVYLCHIAAFIVCRKLFELVGLSGFLPSLLLWAVVLVSSALFVALCQRVLPKRALVVVGFV